MDAVQFLSAAQIERELLDRGVRMGMDRMAGTIALRRMRLAGLAQAGAAQGPAKAELTVSELTAHALREPVSHRAYTVLEVHTKGGLTGYGECSAASDEAMAAAREAATGHAATRYEVIGRQLAAYPAMQAGVMACRRGSTLPASMPRRRSINCSAAPRGIKRGRSRHWPERTMRNLRLPCCGRATPAIALS